jgi:sphingomyelin phosphodiesterase acid-like 3
MKNDAVARRPEPASGRTAKLQKLLVIVMIVLTLIGALPLRALAAPWLFLSDIHLNPDNTRDTPARYGSDTNSVLLGSTIAEMLRVDRGAPVVVITGDFLAHKPFDTARADAVLTLLAHRFNAAFPKAQFVITLGNEDSGCGDYAVAAHAGFLHSVALAWAPLVDRAGAAPSFVRTFSNDGSYTAALPIKHLKAVVIDDVFWAPRYHAGCDGASGGDPTFADLRHALNDKAHESKWVILHIPPGIDAFSTTHLVHRLIDVPFLVPGARDQLLSLLSDPRSHVAMVLAAHTHKFSYRILQTKRRGPVPMLLIPSVSPIFRNAPSFLTVDVRADGIIERADDHAFLDGQWHIVGGTRTLGLRAVSGPELLALQARLARDPRLRQTYARLYSSGAEPEINEGNWRGYWCAANAFTSSAYRLCTGRGSGVSFLTRRGVSFVAVLIVIGVLLTAAATLLYARAARRTNASRHP